MGLASKSLSVLIRDVFLLFSTLLTSVVIARTLGPEIMGVWIIINIIPSYAEMFGRTKVELAAIYFLGKKFHSVGDVLATLNLIAGIVSSLIVVMLLGAYDFLSVTLLKDDADKYSLSLVAVLVLIPLKFFYLNYMYLHTFK
jgi:O-antigen/teichoic acid export membrane protein